MSSDLVRSLMIKLISSKDDPSDWDLVSYIYIQNNEYSNSECSGESGDLHSRTDFSGGTWKSLPRQLYSNPRLLDHRSRARSWLNVGDLLTLTSIP